MATASRPPGAASRLGWAGFALGFALGGFFDGILLHQILQWHHLLSAVEGPAFRDLRVQVLADGAFHAVMYVIAGIGLWLAWRGRRGLGAPGADRMMLAQALIGFGTWHVVDGILSHWILGIHRIRMDVENPLVWDLLWFVVFGIAFVIAGWLVRRRADNDGNGKDGPPGGGLSGGGPADGRHPGGGRHASRSQAGGGGPASAGGPATRRPYAPAALVLSVLVAGPVAALPPPDDGPVMVLFRPGMTVMEVAGAVVAADGRMVWSDPSGQLWAIDLGADGDARQLYRHGAWLVGSGLLPGACFNWSRP